MSSFDRQLEKELEKLKKKKKDTVTPQKSKTNTFDEQLEEELENLKKKGKNTGKDTGKYSDFSVSTTDAIAPVRTHGGSSGKFGSSTDDAKKEEKDRTWFEKSNLFDDGYDFGDVTKTILGSSTDLISNIGAGVIGIGEKVVDAVATVAPYFAQAQWTMNGGDITRVVNPEAAEAFDKSIEQSKKDVAQWVQKDLYDEKKVADAIIGVSSIGRASKSLGVNSEKDSVFGDKTDSLAQSGGQLLGQIGVNAMLPGSGMALMGVTAFGSESENALKQGATLDQAALSGAISAGAEMLTEKIGGISFGGKTLTDAAFSKLSRFMTSKLSSALITTGKVTVDALAEGGEEILSGYMSAIGQKLTYMSDKEIEELFSSEDRLESFIGGVVLGGMGGAFDAVQSSAKGIDPVSDLSKNDKKVVDKVYKDLIAEEEQNGKVSQKRKSEIYDEVLDQLERGGLSTETIEEVLGGENYKAYQDIIEQDNKALAELAELYEGDELKQRAEEFINNSKRNEMAKNLSDSVYDMVKDSRLGESYRDRARRGQKFEADVNQYDEKQRVTIQRAIDSGVLNNTNRTHDMVDLMAKLSADTGVPIDFTNNEKLKDSIFAVNGKIVDGYITEDGITINVNSKKYLNTVVGHEITHSFEGTELYDALEKVMFEYAKEKGTYKDVLKDAYEMYSGQKGYQGYEGLKKIKKEAVANMVGDYLFTDKNFINHLSANHQNIFQKAWNEVKYMVKIARAGSNEAKKLLEVQKAFEEAYRNGGKTPSGTKHSLSETTDGRFAAVVDNDILSNIDTSSWDDNKKAEAKKAAVDALKQFSDGIVVNGINTEVNRVSRREYTRSKDTERLYRKSPDVFADKMRAAEIADDIVVAATNWNRDGGLKHPRQDNFVDFDHGETLIVSGNSKYIAEVVVGITDTGDAVFYDVVDMTPTTFDIKKEESPSTATTQNAIGDILGDSSNATVAQKKDSVKAKFSLSSSVEETKDLVALHNLTEDKLMKSLELGGLPMPSLAITKADIPHSNFGEITLVFGKDTIDPKKNKKNKVYSADAWTPVFPRTEYEADSKVANRVSQKLSELGSKIDDHFQRDLNRVSHGFESYLNSDGGEEGLIQRVMDNYGMKAAYLEEQGKHIDKVTKQEEAQKDYNPANADKYQKIMDILGVTTAEEIGKVNLKDARDNHGAELEAVYPGMTKTAMRMGRLLGVVESYIKNKDIGTVYQTVTDTQATQKAVDDALDAEGYEAWVRNLFSGIVKDSGIYNNKDIFTPSGNRRSFKQTHMPVTLENIVKAMASQNDGNAKNVSGFNGVKTLRAATAETFKSVEEMHQKKGRLQNLSQEQFEAITNDLQNRLYKVMESIDNESGQIGGSNPFIRLDSIGETLAEIGESGKYGVADILRVFNEYSRNISDDTALEVKQLLYDIAQMPVNIFEAKPQRVVNFDEAKVFVIPNNANTKLKQELLNRGYSIAEYDPNVEGDRQKVVNQFQEYRFSLSDANAKPVKHGNWHISGKDVAYEEIAPVAETVSKTESVAPVAENATEELFPDDIAPVHVDLDNLLAQQSEIRGALEAAVSMGDTNTMSMLTQEYENVTARIRELEAQEAERVNSIDDANAPPEMDAPYFGDSDPATVENPFEDRDWYKVGNQKVKAYMYENPEVKPFFQDEALALMTELRDTTKGEKFYSEEAFMVGGNEEAWTGVKRHTSKSIETLLDDWGMSYADIEKGLNAIIEDNGAENIAAAKKIEFMLNDRLLNGYTDFYSNSLVSPNQEYINLLEEMQINEYSEEAFAKFMETADQYAPIADDDIAPVAQPVAPAKTAKEEYLAVTPKRTKEPKMVRVDAPFDQKTAKILTEEPKVQKKNNGLWSMVKENVLDNGMVFEDLALETKNRDLQAKWNFIRYSQSRAQKLIGEGTDSVTALNTVREEVEKSGKLDKFQEYMHHWLNVDRMTLENRFEDTPNKAVFGDSVTADMSRAIAVKLGKENPEFRLWAQELYRYNNYLRELMVENGVISQETAELWAEMYPHYIPVRRIDDAGLDINVPLDTRKTGVNAPIKRATGGSSDILPMFDTMAQRTLQTYKAIAKNSFGVELKNTLGTTIATEQTDVDGVIDGMDYHEELLKEGKKGNMPTFTVFENGEKVTFEITDEMYNAMKPASDLMSYTNKVANTISNVHRGLLTEYNPVFMATNAIKDSQDILINSQHPVKTYAKIPRAIMELAKNGKWFREYMENGGEDNSYFDSDTNSFDTEEKGVRKLLGIPPLSWISKANNFVERSPRLAEYIASREAGRSIEVSMLDAARVTTNFAAGGKLTKFANRNGATFLNASVQGAVQQARNIREAKANGLKGWLQLAGKFAVAGLPAILLNGLMWDDDDDYEELSDYVKQNYYIVAKYGDGKFWRIPKGRTVAVIQNAVEQVMNAATGNDEVDLKSFLELAISNLAPNNPIENNILAPIIQVKNNKTWYGEDLVPARLQDLPAAEQFDESTDAISKWLGEKLNLSPYKINYLLDQYSGGIGDTFLPMLTPEAESGDDSLVGNILAPLKSKFTTDSVMNNQNVSDFYDTKDELTTNAKASGSTDEDVLMNKYMNSINADLSDLYKRKREIQNSKYPASMKYSMVRDVQKQIDALAKESLATYKDVSINGEYATVGDRYFKKNEDGEWKKLTDEQVAKYKATSEAGNSFYATDGKNHYRYYVKEGETEGEWQKIADEQFDKQIEVTRGLGISAAEYWSKKEEYDYAYEYPENYAVAKSVGGYDAFKTYSAELYDIKADKDRNGKTISGSRKDKVLDYLDGLDIDYYAKIILFKNEYNADDTYNEEIVEYLNSRDDIAYEEMVTILKKLGFTVSKDGKTVTW